MGATVGREIFGSGSASRFMAGWLWRNDALVGKAEVVGGGGTPAWRQLAVREEGAGGARSLGLRRVRPGRGIGDGTLWATYRGWRERRG